jgi:copper chaperone CopZ
MRQIFPILFILAFSLTSCIEIVEEINITENKSGNISIKIESDNSGLILNIVNNLFGNSYEDQIKAELDKIARKLTNEKGIEKVEVNLEESSGEYGISCNFSNTADLNRALYKAFGYKKTIFSPGYVKAGSHRLKKMNITPYIKKYLDKENITIPEAYILEMIDYKCIYHVPNEIKRTSNTKVEITNNSKTATIDFPIEKVLDNKVNTGIKIRY